MSKKSCSSCTFCRCSDKYGKYICIYEKQYNKSIKAEDCCGYWKYMYLTTIPKDYDTLFKITEQLAKVVEILGNNKIESKFPDNISKKEEYELQSILFNGGSFLQTFYKLKEELGK